MIDIKRHEETGDFRVIYSSDTKVAMREVTIKQSEIEGNNFHDIGKRVADFLASAFDVADTPGEAKEPYKSFNK